MDSSLLALTKSIFWRNLFVVSQCKNRSCVLHPTLFGYFMTSAMATVVNILFVHNLPSLSRFPYHEACLEVFTIFHIDHNAPFLSPQILHNHCLRLLSGRLYYRGEIGKNGYAKIWRVNKGHYGLCENGELPLPP